MSEEHGNSVRDHLFSKAVRAGKRTYFFDVQSTRRNDLYLTITESKKRMNDDGRPSFEKHKLFLYKEDFEKFSEGLNEAIDQIVELRSGNNEFIDPADEDQSNHTAEKSYSDEKEYTDVSFEDLDKK